MHAAVAMPSGRVVNVTRENSTSVLGNLLMNLDSGLIRSRQNAPRYYDSSDVGVGLGRMPRIAAATQLVRRFGGAEGVMRVYGPRSRICCGMGVRRVR